MRKKSPCLKKIIFLFLVFFLSFSPRPHQNAQAWMTIPATMMEGMMDSMRIQMQGIILGASKAVATKMLYKNVSELVSGKSSEKSHLITNYRTFVFTNPKEKADTYINDYISQTVGGQNSSNYTSAEGFGDYSFSTSGGSDYRTQLANNAKSLTSESDEDQEVGYVGNPGENLFSEGNLDNFNTYLSGINNPWAYNLDIEQKYQERLEEEQEAARLEALAGQGFKSTKQDGSIITPGSVTAAQMNESATIGQKVIGGANSPSEAMVGVAVAQMISQTIEDGIGDSGENASEDSDGDTSEDDGSDSYYNGDGSINGDI